MAFVAVVDTLELTWIPPGKGFQSTRRKKSKALSLTLQGTWRNALHYTLVHRAYDALLMEKARRLSLVLLRGPFFMACHPPGF